MEVGLENILIRYPKITNGRKWSKVFIQVHIGKRTPHSSGYETVTSRHWGLDLSLLLGPLHST